MQGFCLTCDCIQILMPMVVSAAQAGVGVSEIVLLCLCVNICYVFAHMYACPGLSELHIFLSAPLGPAAERERPRASESPSR